MNCTSCKKPMASGAAKCAACGAAADYSYDLLPDEPEGKKEEGGPGQQYQLPPGAVLPPGTSMPSDAKEKPSRVLRADRQRGAASSGRGGTNFKTLGIGAGVLLILVVLGMKMCGGASVKITGPGARIDGSSFGVSNIMTQTRNFEIFGGKAEYTFTVEPKNGDVRVGVIQRGSRDKITPEIVKSWSLTPVKKGENKTMTGELETGSYSFVVATDSKLMIQGSLKARVK